MKKLLRFLCCMMLCGLALPMSSVMAQTFDFYVVDICVEGSGGDIHGYAHPNDSRIADFCAGTADECGSGSSTLYQYIVGDGYENYTQQQLNAVKGKCLRVRPYGYWYDSSNNPQTWEPNDFLGSQTTGSTGWMVICVAGGSDTTCEKYKEGCDSNYLGETQWRKLVLQNLAYTVPQPPQQLLVNRIYQGRTDNMDCCLGETNDVCLGRTGSWTTHTTYAGCEYGNYAKSCSLEGACSVAMDENYGQARCKPGYFDDNGHSVINKAKCGGGASGMVCDPCPTADAGWTATSPVGSSECSQCYEYKSDASCEGGEAIRNAKSTCNGYNSTDICDKICTPGTVCGDWTSYNDKTESQTCTITADDCETSSTTMYRCKSGYYA
ncbi:MAG: hypothetical protein J6Y49_00160, partial [Alphaproteobacteria bacterium]|nr:hypothetical protein [Alphaproteobacteria bacterium]